MWRAIAQQRDGRKAAVGHRDHPPPRRPTGDLRQHLARPARELFVAPVALGSVSLGGRQHGQEGQTPDPPGPGHGREQHDAEPAQAAGLDEMPVAGADRVAVDPPRRDPGAPAPLDGVVEADHHRTVRHEGGDQQPQEPVREGARAPVPVAQRALADSKTRSLAQPHDAQRRGDGSTPRRQQGAARQHEHVTPDRGGEVASEGPRPAVQPLGNHARRHGAPPPPGSPKAGTRERGAMGDSNNAMRADRGLALAAPTWRRRGGAGEPRPHPLQPAHRCARRAAASTGKGDDVQVLWWRRDAWGNPGPFGPEVMPLDQALDFVASEGFFWIHAS